MIPSKVMAKMATLGFSEEQAIAVANMLAEVELATETTAQSRIEVAVEAGREKSRARWLRWNEKHRSNADKRLQTAANASKQLVGEHAPVEDKTSNLEIEPQEESKKRANALSPEFEEFWIAFPNKVGKPKARAAFTAAARKAAPVTIIAGLQRYIAAKPADRPWLNPATFLNQERWADQPAPMARAGPAPAVGKDSVANAARRRLEEMENGSRQSGFDDHQQVAGLISGNHIRLVG